MNYIKPIYSYITFVRIRDWWYLNGIFLLGFLYRTGEHIQPRNIIIGLLISSLYLAHGYTVNEWYDRVEQECKNVYWLGAIIFKIIPLVLLCANVLIVWFFAPRCILYYINLGAFISWVYSSLQARHQSTPQFRLILNSLGFSLLFIMGAGFKGVLYVGDLALLLYIVIVFLIIDLFHMLNDMEVDYKTGKKTFPNVCGIDKTITYVLFLMCGLLGYSLIIVLMGLVSFLFFMNTAFVAISLYILLMKSKKQKGVGEYRGIKMRAKKILMVYGIIMLVLFMFF